MSVTNTGQPVDLDQITTRLKNFGIPIKSIQISNDSRWNPPIVIECILQSSSQDDKVSPEDVVYYQTLEHEMNFSNFKELNIGAIHTTLLNTSGKVIVDVFEATRKGDEISSGFSLPSSITNSELSSLLKDLPLNGIKLNSINASLIDNGQHRIIFELQCLDISTAHVECANVIRVIQPKITELNQEQNSQVVISEIHVVDGNGNPLFYYIKDFQFGGSTWWQSDKIDKMDLH